MKKRLFLIAGITMHLCGGALFGGTGISGTVTTQTGEPMQGVYLYAYDISSGGGALPHTWTWTNGVYSFINLPPGSYKLEVDTGVNAYLNHDYYRMYKSEWFRQKDFYSDAEVITVTASQMVSNINFSLVRLASIEGRVVDQSLAPIAGIHVSPLSVGDSSSSVVEGITDTNGQYTAYCVGGTYRLVAGSATLPYQTKYYDNKDYANANLLTLATGDRLTNINFALQRYSVGGIRGQVLAPNGTPEAWMNVALYGNGVWRDAYSDASGIFSFSSLPEGSYTLQANTYYYPYVYMPYDRPVPVVAGQITSNIVIRLIYGGKITGQATGTNGTPVVGLRISASALNGGWGNTYTDTNGNYVMEKLLPGEYRLLADSADTSDLAVKQYLVQYYSHRTNMFQADGLQVREEQTLSNINFSLDLGGRISGRVLNTGSNPVPSVRVNAWRQEDGANMYAYANSSGEYVLAGLPPGAYAVQPEISGYPQTTLALFYQNKPSQDSADRLVITGTENLTNIDLTTQVVPGNISGSITAPGGSGLVELEVVAFSPQGRYVRGTTTDNNGWFTISSLPPGNYIVAALPSEYNDLHRTNFAYKFYPNTRDPHLATAVTVTSGSTAGGIIMGLSPTAGIIKGRVTRAADGLPITNKWVEVELRDYPSVYVGAAYTDTNGNYEIRGIPPGDHVAYLHYSPEEPLQTQYYNQKNTRQTADTITMPSTPGLIANVDFVLLPNSPYWPPAAGSLAPAHETTENPPRFGWAPAEGASLYELQVTDVTLGTQVYRNAVLTGTNVTLPGPLAVLHKYEFRVRAGNGAGWSMWTSPVSFNLLPVQYSLGVQLMGPGSVVMNPPGGTYVSGTLVQLTASETNGSNFDSWSGAVSNRFAPGTSILMNSNQAVVANFIANRPPQQPLCVSPPDGASSVSLQPILIASAFADPDPADTRLVTHWQLAAASNSFNVPLWDTNSASGQIQVPLGILSYSNYYWRVSHQDIHGLWSAWSAIASMGVTLTIDTVTNLPGGPFTLSWPTENARSYTVYVTTNISTGPWSAATNVAGNGQVLTYSDPATNVVAKYYRIGMP